MPTRTFSTSFYRYTDNKYYANIFSLAVFNVIKWYAALNFFQHVQRFVSP